MAAIGRYNTSRARRRLRDYITVPYRQMDYGILVAALALVAFGLLMVFSASLFVSLAYQERTTFYFQRQFLAAGLGLAFVIGFQFVDYRLIRRISTPAMLGTLVLLFVVLFVGDTLLGARRGLYEGSFQPSELAKLVTVCYVADWISSKGERIKELEKGLIPFVIMVGIVGALIAVQPDLSTAVLIVLVSFTMFLVAGSRWPHFVGILLVGVLVFVLLVNVFPHAAQRIHDYVAMIKDPANAEWHNRQIFYALARGGLLGQGLGKGFQKTGPLPVPHTDSILAVVGEELGLVGCLVVLILTGVLAYRGYRLVLDTVDPYGRLLALGIVSWLAYQALVNAAVVTGVVPFTGLPFPLISYGGSSMVVSLLGVGILVNISQQNKRLEAGLTRPEGHKRGHAAAGVGRRDRWTYSTRSGHRR